jgi:hypothetical protein
MSKPQLSFLFSELWTSFKHAKSTFFKICPTKNMWAIKLSIHSQNKLLIWTKTPPWVIFQSQTLIVKSHKLWFQQWFRRQLSMVNQLFLKICLNKKMWKIKLPFTSKNPFLSWSFYAKVMDKFWTLNVFWTLFITFEWRIEITA